MPGAPPAPGQSVSRWSALVAGGSGLVGSRLLAALAATAECGRIIAITRRPLAYEHPKLANRIVPFDNLAESIGAVRADVAFCCLGTTLKARARERLFARSTSTTLWVSRARPARRGVRASFSILRWAQTPLPGDFYLRVKGETEEAIAKLGFAALDILQPSLLLGVRADLPWRARYDGDPASNEPAAARQVRTVPARNRERARGCHDRRHAHRPQRCAPVYVAGTSRARG